MTDRLSEDYIVSSDTTEPLLSGTFQDIDVLFSVPLEQDLSNEERVAIRDFVAQGGSLLLLGKMNYGLANEAHNGNLYQLLSDLTGE